MAGARARLRSAGWRRRISTRPGARGTRSPTFNQPVAIAGSVPLRRASMADIPAILALKNAAYTPNESIIGVPSLPRIADYAEIVAEHEVWLADGPRRARCGAGAGDRARDLPGLEHRRLARGRRPQARLRPDALRRGARAGPRL